MNVSQNSDLMRYMDSTLAFAALLTFRQPEICFGSLPIMHLNTHIFPYKIADGFMVRPRYVVKAKEWLTISTVSFQPPRVAPSLQL